RDNSSAPTWYSRSRICRLSEGCEVWSRRSAAVVRLPSSTTATKKRRGLSSMTTPCLKGMPSDLRETAIDKEFRPGDVAAVVGGEENHGPGNLVGRSQSAERNAAGDHLPA